MKVLQVIDRLNAGGAERLMIHLSNLLYKNKVDVAVLLFNSGGNLDKELDKGIRIYDLNRANKFNPITLYHANNVCVQYDIVHTHLRHVHAYVQLAKFLFRGKYKIILHDHAAIASPVPARLKGIFKPSYYIGVNKDLKEWATNVIGVKPGSAFLLENFISPGNDSTVNNNKNGRAILIGNIRSVKNIEFAISLCNSINMPLDIYGNVLEPAYYQKLIELIGINKYINIIHGVSDFSSLIPQYTLGIHCSLAETGPIVLLEYLFAGLPFVSFQTGSIADKIALQLPQLFISGFDAEKWKVAITQNLADAGLSEKMKKLFDQINQPRQYLKQCQEIYQTIYSS